MFTSDLEGEESDDGAALDYFQNTAAEAEDSEDLPEDSKVRCRQIGTCKEQISMGTQVVSSVISDWHMGMGALIFRLPSEERCPSRRL